MKLISTEFGQSFQQFVIDELRPLSGGLYTPGLIAAVAERYKFAAVPTLSDAIQQGAKFAEGYLAAQGTIISIRQLGIYNDGIIVVTFNTDDSDLVLKDVVEWSTQTFKLREPITRVPVRHISSVVVEFKMTLERAFHGLSEFMRTFEAALKSAYDWEYPIEPTRIVFGADPTQMPSYRSADFVIERRTGRPFLERRYYSTAPFQTSVHVELLGRFERLISKIRK